MINVERRRRIRKAVPIAAAVLLSGVAAALILIFKPFSAVDKETSASPSPTEAPTVAPEETASITKPPAPTEAASEAPTAEPDPTPSAEPTDPVTETPPASTEHAPIRISDDLSAMLVTLDVSVKYDSQGVPRAESDGAVSLEFVNNTDSILYSVELGIGNAEVISATIDGSAVNYTVNEGVVTIPFFNELPQNRSVYLFIEYSYTCALDETVAFPSLTYDSPLLLTAYVSSPIPLYARGFSFSSVSEGGIKTYSVSDTAVKNASISFTGQ